MRAFDERMEQMYLESYWNTKIAETAEPDYSAGERKAQDFIDPEADVKFHLFTRENPWDPQEISHLNWTSIVESDFNPKVPTRFYIHGWLSTGGSGRTMRKGRIPSKPKSSESLSKKNSFSLLRTG